MTSCEGMPQTQPAGAVAPASLRRGACPSLAAPMATGDGLLVRLRPVNPDIGTSELSLIARAAARYGNGILEVTARGNLQVRGLSADSASDFADEMDMSRIALSQGVAIELPPLAGFDPDEIADPQPLAISLRAAIAGRQPALSLAPKLSIVIDGGGTLHLGETAADIRLRALDGAGSRQWLLSVAGTDKTASRIGVFSDDTAVDGIMAVLTALNDLGAFARGRDLDATVLRERLSALAISKDAALPLRSKAPLAVGLHDFGRRGFVLGLGLAFGQVRSDDLVALIDAIETAGASSVRLSPGHALLVTGLTPDAAETLRATARALGLRIFADDPANRIAVCAGTGACRTALADTRQAANDLLAFGAGLMDGSLEVHISGCAKGCARPSAAALTLVAAPTGYGLVVNGRASDPALAYTEQDTLKLALRRLHVLLRDKRHAGETARSCLERLGPDPIVNAFRQG